MSDGHGAPKKSFTSVCGSPKLMWPGVCALVVAVVIFVVFVEAIGNAWPLTPRPADGRIIIWSAVVFWLVLIIGVVLCALHVSGRLLKENLGDQPQMRCAGGLTLAGLICLFLAPGASHYAGPHPFYGALVSLYSLICLGGAVAVFVLADVYIFRLIWAAAWKGTEPRKDERWPGIPERVPALFVVLLLFLALVLAFGRLYIASAQIYRGSTLLDGPSDALYYSVVTITTLGYGDYAPNDSNARWLVVFELMSGLLFLIMAFPILGSRLADFGEEEAGEATIQRTDDGLEVTGIQKTPFKTSTQVTISSTGKLTISDQK